jgi:integrase
MEVLVIRASRRDVEALHPRAVIASYEAVGLPAEASAFARSAVLACDPAGTCRARTLLWTCARLAAFGIGIGLVPLAEVLLEEAVIERFVAVGLSRLTESTRRSVRANLRFVAARCCPRVAPARSAEIGRDQLIPPYGAAEVAAMFSLARHQPTAARQMRLQALLCLGLGAGLSGSDLRQVTGQHVQERHGAVVVEICGRRERTVPVLARYGEKLLVSARYSGAAYLTGGSSPERRNLTARLVGNLAGGDDAPRIEPRRLRVTWLVEVCQLTGLGGLLGAAGITSSGRLGDIAAHCPPLGGKELAVLLGAIS